MSPSKKSRRLQHPPRPSQRHHCRNPYLHHARPHPHPKLHPHPHEPGQRRRLLLLQNRHRYLPQIHAPRPHQQLPRNRRRSPCGHPRRRDHVSRTSIPPPLNSPSNTNATHRWQTTPNTSSPTSPHTGSAPFPAGTSSPPPTSSPSPSPPAPPPSPSTSPSHPAKTPT